MKTILCTGDSHTWGQGVPGLEESFSPPVVAGDLRLVPFRFKSYVNLLRDEIGRAFGSEAAEMDAGGLCSLSGNRAVSNSALIGEKPLSLEFEGELVRLQLMRDTEPSAAEIRLDGESLAAIDLRADFSENNYKNYSFYCPPGKHTLTVCALEGSVLLYRVETYRGRYAVVNCGIGSCPVEKFVSGYFDDYAAVFRPAVTVLEAHTINDWLFKDPPERYRARLISAIEAFLSLGSRVLLLTVSPILGAQAMPFNPVPYSEYVEQSRAAAAETGVPLCDANALMGKLISGLDEEEAFALLYKDNWHVNALGHKIYAGAICTSLEKNNML